MRPGDHEAGRTRRSAGDDDRVCVLVCDARPAERARIDRLLASDDIEVVAMTGDRTEVLPLVGDRAPHVVLVGVDVAGITLDEFVRLVRSMPPGPFPAVLALISGDDRDLASLLLVVDLAGVVERESSGRDLRLAVRTAATGVTVLGPHVARRLVDWIRDEPRRPCADT